MRSGECMDWVCRIRYLKKYIIRTPLRLFQGLIKADFLN